MARVVNQPISSSGLTIKIAKSTYRFINGINGGSFGEIYLARDIATKAYVAIKVEERYKSPQLAHEHEIYKLLEPGVGVPRILGYGQVSKHSILVMDMLGLNLELLFNYCKRRFTMKTIVMLADQMIARVEHVHQNNIVHRDIKPQNFVIGLGNQNKTLFLIDFGLSKQYRDKDTHQHMPYCANKRMAGTARYASINAHNGIEQSRRDDLESIGYLLVYFLKGELPWQGLDGFTIQQRLGKMSQMKPSTPVEFATYLNYCAGLEFDEAPDYMYLRLLFRELGDKLNIQYDGELDWNIRRRRKSLRRAYKAGRSG